MLFFSASVLAQKNNYISEFSRKILVSKAELIENGCLYSATPEYKPWTLSKSMLMLNKYRIKLPALKNLGDKEWKELLRD